MRFLHLSDLHIGKSVNGFSMLDEQRHVFAQIFEYIQTERPEAVIIAGDIYDRAVPGIEAVRVFDDFLTRLACEEVAVLLIAGNHDSPERLGYASRLLMDKRLFLCGSFDGSMRKVTLPDAYGEVNFWLLPFIKPLSAQGVLSGRVIESYTDALAAAIETADVDYTARNVLVAHQFFTAKAAAPIRSESEINPVGGLDAVEADMAASFDYVALGHLHRPQKIGAEHIRYAGSPLKYSFSECRQRKSVTLVDLLEKGNLSITELPVTPIHDMREMKGELAKLLSDETVSSADREDYLRVILTDEAQIIDPMGKIRSVYPHVMTLGFENARTSAALSDISPVWEQTAPMSPYDVFAEFFLDINGAVMSDEQAKIVQALLNEGAMP